MILNAEATSSLLFCLGMVDFDCGKIVLNYCNNNSLMVITTLLMFLREIAN